MTTELVLEKRTKKGTGELKNPREPRDSDDRIVVRSGDPDDRWPWATTAPDRQSGGQTYGFIG